MVIDMEYQGSENDDVIDQLKLGLPDWSSIFGGAGNDTITLKIGHALGGAGNDTYYGTTQWSNVAYWGVHQGVRIDFSKGTAEDGFGGIDTFVNITSVHGSGFNDDFIGSTRNEFFHGGGGNDTFVGGGGTDEVAYYNVKSTDAKITYDATNDTFTVVKNFSNGDRGTDILRGISTISFTGDGSDNNYILKDSFAPVNGFLRMPGATSIVLPSGSGVGWVKAGDFNGDGNMDFYMSSQKGTGTAPSPMFIFLGDGTGKFTDGTATVFPNAPELIVGGGRAIAADFNRDGLSDIFQCDFGDDAPPFPGGLNHLFLSSAEKRQLSNASQDLNQVTATNHAASDVNGDGYLDVLVNSLNLGNVLLINDKTGHFSVRADLLPKLVVPLYGSSYPQTSTSSGIVDVNGDRFGDLILGKWDGDSSTLATQVLLNDGNGNFAASTPISLPSSGVAKEIVLDVKAINLNGDARPDLMLSVTNGGGSSSDYGDGAYYTTAYIQLLVNEGDGKFRDETSVRLPASVQSMFGKGWFESLTSVDFNHDGHADILASSGGFTSSFVLLNQGNGTFSPGWSSVKEGRSVAADVNSDGASDIVTVTGQSAYVVMNQFENGRLYKANFGGDSLLGSSGSDQFLGSAGNDSLNGGGGIDVVTYTGRYSNFKITKTSTGLIVNDNTKAEGTDSLIHMERLKFSDTAVAFDIDGNAGKAYRLYLAAFDRAPDPVGLGFWINALDTGHSMQSVSSGFIGSNEFKTLYGSAPSNFDLLTRFYQNVLHRAPDEEGFNWWLDAMNRGSATPIQTLIDFSESAENKAQVIGSIQNGIEYQVYG